VAADRRAARLRRRVPHRGSRAVPAANVPVMRYPGIPARWRAGLVAAAAAFCGVACGPNSTERSASPAKDATCLDPRSDFANGARRVAGIVRMDLRVSNDEWAELTRMLRAFAESHQWSFRDSSLSRPNVVKTLEIRLCAPGQPAVQIVEQRWASND